MVTIPLIVGRIVNDDIMIYDFARMRHLLIIGAITSGKFAYINVLVASLLHHAFPED
jgi:DNA segregation ATPase FtsK/SpoIIIE-like protein